ncbi:MAG: iron-containing alcohol dehydrogenase [Kiritimatiellae bacterium]|nr:iron-containing alcohol dehydrogenase [Kiritimatiellia bacterium]
MNDFEFESPTHFAFGRGAERRTGELVRAFGGTRALLHFGGGSVKANGVYGKVVDALESAGVGYVPLGGVKPNPREALVREGIDLVRREGIDFILAVGGGSAIDSAKAIAFGAVYDGDFRDHAYGKDCRNPPVVKKAMPVGAVLTIAAAGSEGSCNSIISLEPDNLKRTLSGDALRPRFAVMNPEFTFTLPPYQTACGLADIFAHVAERYFTPTRGVAVTDEVCEALMRTVVSEGAKVMRDGRDYDARANVMWAGTLAHNNVCGVGRVQDWASHGIEHELSALYDCAHGAGLAVVMPAWMEFVMDADVARFARFAERVWGVAPGPDGRAVAKEGIARYRAWLESIGLPTTFAGLGARAEDIPRLAANLGLAEGQTLGRFRPLSAADVESLLSLAV